MVWAEEREEDGEERRIQELFVHLRKHFLFRFALPVREGWSTEVFGDLVSLLGWQRPRKWTEFTPRKINAVLADVISSAQWLHSFLSSTIVRVPASHPG